MSVTVVVTSTIVYTVGKPQKALPGIPYQTGSLDKQYIAIIGMNFTTLYADYKYQFFMCVFFFFYFMVRF